MTSGTMVVSNSQLCFSSFWPPNHCLRSCFTELCLDACSLDSSVYKWGRDVQLRFDRGWQVLAYLTLPALCGCSALTASNPEPQERVSPIAAIFHQSWAELSHQVTGTEVSAGRKAIPACPPLCQLQGLCCFLQIFLPFSILQKNWPFLTHLWFALHYIFKLYLFKLAYCFMKQHKTCFIKY